MVDIEFDLHFQTAGIPMLWRITPRYELPADVKGTYKIAGSEFQIEGVGQRDHSFVSLLSFRFTDSYKLGNERLVLSQLLRELFFLVRGVLKLKQWGNLHLDDGTRIQAMCEYQNFTFQQGYTQKDGVSDFS